MNNLWFFALAMIILQVFCPFQRLWRGLQRIVFYAFQLYDRHQNIAFIDLPVLGTERFKKKVLENI
jgi:hypothetical protein